MHLRSRFQEWPFTRQLLSRPKFAKSGFGLQLVAFRLHLHNPKNKVKITLQMS